MTPILFITGTDTAVGKTVLTAALLRFLRERGTNVAVMKPLSSGSRTDARQLCTALGQGTSLDEINPWHFRAPLAPVLAARGEGRAVRLAEVVARVRAVAARCEVLLMEGAGGLMSPLGEDFSSRELIAALRARPIVVVPNRLGAVGQARLAMAALPASTTRSAALVLMQPARPDAASRSNAALLAEFLGAGRIHPFPRLTSAEQTGRRPLRPAAHAVLARLNQQ